MTQLRLVPQPDREAPESAAPESDAPWRLSNEDKEQGRQGLAEARAALRRARARRHADAA